MACQKQSSEADEDAQKNQSLLLYVGFAVANLSYYEKNQGLATLLAGLGQLVGTDAKSIYVL